MWPTGQRSRRSWCTTTANSSPEAETTIDDFTLDGYAFYNASSAPSAIDSLNLSSTLDLDGDAVLSIQSLTNEAFHDSATINAPNTSTLTVGDAVIDGTLTMNLGDVANVSITSVTNLIQGFGTLNVNDGGVLTVCL